MFGLQSVEAKYVSWMPGNLKIDPLNLVNYLETTELKDDEFVKFKKYTEK